MEWGLSNKKEYECIWIKFVSIDLGEFTFNIIAYEESTESATEICSSEGSIGGRDSYALRLNNYSEVRTLGYLSRLKVSSNLGGS